MATSPKYIFIKAHAKYVPMAQVKKGQIQIIFEVINGYSTIETKIFYLPRQNNEFRELSLWMFGGTPGGVMGALRPAFSQDTFATYTDVELQNLYDAFYTKCASGNVADCPRYFGLNKKRFRQDFIEHTILMVQSLGPNEGPKAARHLNSYYKWMFTDSTDDDVTAEMQKHVDEFAAMLASGAWEAEASKIVEEYENNKNQDQAADLPGGEDSTGEMGTDTGLPNPATPSGGTPPSQTRGPNAKKPVVTKDGLPVEDLLVAGKVGQEKLGGILGEKLLEPMPVFDLDPGDVALEPSGMGGANCGVYCFRDPSYRLKGHTGAAGVYNVVGKAWPENVHGKSPGHAGLVEEGAIIKTRTDLKRDAAYLYLSQKCDPDRLTGATGGSYAQATNTERRGESSAILKADGVLVMARQSGIRLITGTDQKNSKGGDTTAVYGIDIIAGNHSKTLQPMVLGDNLVAYLEKSAKNVSKLQAVVFDFLKTQIIFNAKLATHRHYDPFLILMGSAVMNNPLGVNGGQNFPSSQVAAAATQTLLEGLRTQQGAINQTFEQIMQGLNALTQFGAGHLLSDKNRVN